MYVVRPSVLSPSLSEFSKSLGLLGAIREIKKFLSTTPEGQRVAKALNQLKHAALEARKGVRTLLSIYLKGLLTEDQ
ncbi:hypothetical protein TcWFU_008312 [Taenia crassiceps]|uniref:Uncharacterized protein n=1 Tax=Taenia crassiceps TaxID=6207 RepID=A0ABR4Q6L9_9CEST